MWHRKPVVAGAFYPADRDDLSGVIKEYMDKAEIPPLEGEVLGIISPHAGYVYSGPVAAFSFKLIQDMNPEVVVVLAPSHRSRFNGGSVIPGGIYETPLGNVSIDEKIGEALDGKGRFVFIKEAHQQEHSLEVQVPFLQSVFDDFTLVPIVIGSVEMDVCRDMADELYDVLKKDGRRFLLVISTDLSHYHSYESARELDGRFIESLKTFNEESIKEAIGQKGAEACGEGPILTGLMLAGKLGGDTVEVLKYATSGDTAGDKSQVVGYLSAALIKQ